MSIVIGFLVVSALIVIHELGHFVAGLLCGIRAVTFSLGFGPTLLAFEWRGTVYKVSAILLGGYVRFRTVCEEEPAQSHGNRPVVAFLFSKTEAEQRLLAERAGENLFAAPPAHQMVVLLGGAVANLGTAFLCTLAVPIWFIHFYEYSPDLRIGEIRHPQLAEAGLAVGDRVVSLNDMPLTTWAEYQEAVHNAHGQPTTLNVLRPTDGTVDQRVTLAIPHIEAATPLLFQIRPVQIRVSRTIGQNLRDTFRFWQKTLQDVLGSAGMVLRSPIERASGPVEAYQAIGISVSQGALDFLGFVIVGSLTLGLFNLLPFPATDGGHLACLTWELITGKKIPTSIRRPAESLMLATFLVLMLLMLVKDLHSLGSGKLFRDSTAVRSKNHAR
ncbi:MAG: site-2 protease family protein [Planctomycetaceae bacterium]|nr:site-2 protease family protein [Planctomycetaceae bacterium]